MSGSPEQSPAGEQQYMQTIDFSNAQAFFGQYDRSRSPIHDGQPYQSPPLASYSHHQDELYHSPPAAYSHRHDASPPTVSGLDPVSKLGFTSNRAFSPQQPASAFGWPGNGANHGPPFHHGGSAYPFSFQQPFPLQSPYTAFSPQSLDEGYNPQSSLSTSRHESQVGTSALHQRKEDAAHRTAEVERRNRRREEEKTRRTIEIQKQVDDGMAALKLEKDEAAHRSAEVERRNKAREEEKARRMLAVRRQVEDGIKAIKLEKQRERARVQGDRLACRKWLSDLPGASSTSKVDVYAAIGRQLRGFWESSRPAATSQPQRLEVIADVQRAIRHKWVDQGLKVAAFGSSVTGLVTDKSDLDLVLLDPTRPHGVGTPSDLCVQAKNFVRHTGGMPEWYSTNQIASAIRASNKFRNVVSISGASVPIVKMVHKKYGIPADININERFGLYNSQLISAYGDLQPDLVRPLIFFLKHWYSRRDLNDPAGKKGSMTFSSYTIALMALQVLQVEGVLPNLQNPDLLRSLNVQPSFLYSRAKRPRARRGNGRGDNTGAAEERNGQGAAEDTAAVAQRYDVTFASKQVDAESYRKKALELTTSDDPVSPEDTQLASDRLLGKMLVAFVQFYSKLDRRTQAVSVVKGAPLARRRSSQPRHVLFDSASEDGASEAETYDEETDVWAGEELVVQDPFIIDRNTSRNIKSTAIEMWHSEMRRAQDLLRIHKLDQSGKVRLEEVPLILDLCISENVLAEMEAEGLGVDGSAAVGSDTDAAAVQQRDIAKQAAQILRREKKQKARRARRGEARALQEEAAMVEDMIDGIESGTIGGFVGNSSRRENWRLRVDNDVIEPKEDSNTSPSLGKVDPVALQLKQSAQAAQA